MLFVTPNSNLCINYRNHNGDKPYQWIAVSESFFIHFIYSHLFSSLLFQFQSMFMRILVMWRKLLKSCVLCLIVMTALWLVGSECVLLCCNGLCCNVVCCDGLWYKYGLHGAWVVFGLTVMIHIVLIHKWDVMSAFLNCEMRLNRLTESEIRK